MIFMSCSDNKSIENNKKTALSILATMPTNSNAPTKSSITDTDLVFVEIVSSNTTREHQVRRNKSLQLLKASSNTEKNQSDQIVFDDNSSISLSYSKITDSEEIKDNVENLSLTYKDSEGNSYSANYCEIQSGILNCNFKLSPGQQNFASKVLNNSSALKISLHKSEKSIQNSMNYSEANVSGRNYAPWQLYLAALWWDCHFWHNSNSCNQLNAIVNSYCGDKCGTSQTCSGGVCQCITVCTRCDGSTYTQGNYYTCY